MHLAELAAATRDRILNEREQDRQRWLAEQRDRCDKDFAALLHCLGLAELGTFRQGRNGLVFASGPILLDYDTKPRATGERPDIVVDRIGVWVKPRDTPQPFRIPYEIKSSDWGSRDTFLFRLATVVAQSVGKSELDDYPAP